MSRTQRTNLVEKVQQKLETNSLPPQGGGGVGKGLSFFDTPYGIMLDMWLLL